ncbi:MAG TPA: hypothetical protein DD670_09400 [Planctomycetaceae bacterium]|nr:hypothetical protein [Planctomycetaceae bacterium]
MDSLPLSWQYAILAGVALVVTLGGLWLYNRRERRRKHALALMRLMDQWGLAWFAEVYADYAVGDYSGLVRKIKEVVEAVRSDEAMVGKLWEVTKKVTAHAAANDSTKADELRALLGATTSANRTTLAS